MPKDISSLPELIDDYELVDLIKIAGYSYDPKQDIFISTESPWQRNIGYCRLFDEAAAPLGMIIDCEPIYFEYNNKKWMIGFWKGQYDLVTGGEIGVYTDAFDLKISQLISGTYYKVVKDEDFLQLAFTLKKNGQHLFTRQGKHWWLTGFKLGMFSEPSELSMEVKITLKDDKMRDAFVSGMKKAGYSDKELFISGNSVYFVFNTPHTRQPFTRIPDTDRIIQRKNKLLCDTFQDLTKSYENSMDKIKAIKDLDPEIYGKILKGGKAKQSYEIFIASTMVVLLILSYLIARKDNKMESKDYR